MFSQPVFGHPLVLRGGCCDAHHPGSAHQQDRHHHGAAAPLALHFLDLDLAYSALVPSLVFDAIAGHAINIGRHEANDLVDPCATTLYRQPLEAYERSDVEFVGHVSALPSNTVFIPGRHSSITVAVLSWF